MPRRRPRTGAQSRSIAAAVLVGAVTLTALATALSDPTLPGSATPTAMTATRATTPSATTSSATTSSGPVPAGPWKGQLTGPLDTAAPKLTGPKDGVARDAKSLTPWTTTQLDAAWRQVTTMLTTVSAPTSLVDPTRVLTTADLTAVAAPTMTPSAQEALRKIGPVALQRDPAAFGALRPLMFWYDATDAAAATELRPAAHPFGAFKVTQANAAGVSAGARSGIAFQVQTELTLNLVDRNGLGNTLFLNRTLNVVMVPAPASRAAGTPAWLVDAWSGQWQTIKPKGQALPTDTGDVSTFNPGSPPAP